MRLSIDFSVRCVHAAMGTSVHIFSPVLLVIGFVSVLVCVLCFICNMLMKCKYNFEVHLHINDTFCYDWE